MLFLAPAAHHRIRFREGDKEFMLRKGNREVIAVSVAFFALIVWRWWALAVYREVTD